MKETRFVCLYVRPAIGSRAVNLWRQKNIGANTSAAFRDKGGVVSGARSGGRDSNAENRIILFDISISV